MKKASLRNVTNTGNELDRTFESHEVTEERNRDKRFQREDSKHLEEDADELI